ncbi:hypothetical protein CIT31_13490 [Mesorhizobium wenxiniae]|uniref:Uncharacterized protein n=1 Tax=Mesorhizobium wenxiniae TaxID=2014805 RepID=A0A271KGY1_9HYPH|nr:hypothetical protein CIT31_13490 [Mesorhizobium wenxiniae]
MAWSSRFAAAARPRYQRHANVRILVCFQGFSKGSFSADQLPSMGEQGFLACESRKEFLSRFPRTCGRDAEKAIVDVVISIPKASGRS